MFTHVMSTPSVLEREGHGEILHARTNGKRTLIPATFETRVDGDAAMLRDKCDIVNDVITQTGRANSPW